MPGDGFLQMSLLPTRILFATDGSPDAVLASRAAVDLSKDTGSELHVVHAWHRVPLYIHPSVTQAPDPRPYEREARALLDEQLERVKGMGGRVEGDHLRVGPPADEILEAAEELAAGLIVMGSRGLGPVERLAVGSVSEEVVHYAPCPVLVMRGGEEAWPPRRIVVGDDSSEEARRAGEIATEIGKLFGANVLIVRAYPEFLRKILEEGGSGAEISTSFRRAERDLEKRAEELDEQLGYRPQTRVEEADATTALLDAARDRPALIVVGSRGLGIMGRIRRGRTRRLGSVSTKVLRAAGAPVLVCRQV